MIYFTQSPPEIIYFKNTPASPPPPGDWMVAPYASMFLFA